MSAIQHVTAPDLLRVIWQAHREGRRLTYKSAAAAIGRDPDTHARMVAQCCDLLDAAAALAGRPLLALYVVRQADDRINQRAWAGPSGRRDAIIRHSQAHKFTDDDIGAVAGALERLSGKGNRKAWEYVRATIAPNQLYASLTGQHIQSDDAIDDIGSDRPTRTSGTTHRYSRDPKIREAVLQRAAGRCELCGQEGFLCEDGDRYLESHHIIALAAEGCDRMTNVIALCPGDHREAHYGARRVELERRMIVIVAELESEREQIGNC